MLYVVGVIWTNVVIYMMECVENLPFNSIKKSTSSMEYYIIENLIQ